MAKEDGLELIVGGFRTGERGSEGEEVVVGLEIGLFERGFEEVWTRLGLIGGLIVGVFLIYVILVGICEILLCSIKIWVNSEEAERSDSSRVVFCEIRIFEGDETIFFIVGFIEADLGEVVVVFEEEEGDG